MCLHRAHGQLQFLGYVVVVHAVEIAHPEHLPALFGQHIDGVLYLAAQFGVLHPVQRVVVNAAVILHTHVVYVLYSGETTGIHVAAFQHINRPCVHGTVKKPFDIVFEVYLVHPSPQPGEHFLHHVVGIALVGKQTERVEIEPGVSAAKDAVKHYAFVFTHVHISFL